MLESEISNFFGVRPEWLLGHDDYKTAGSILKEKFDDYRLSNHKRHTALVALAELSGYGIECILCEDIPEAIKSSFKTKCGTAYKITKDGRIVGYCSSEKIANIGLDMQELAEQRLNSYLREIDNG